MVETLKYLGLVLLIVVVCTLTGCNNDKKDYKFKNPKYLTINNLKAKSMLTYDGNGSYEVKEVDDSDKVLINSKKEFRMEFMYGSQTIKQQKKSNSYAKKDKRLVVLDVEFNGYKGYVSINKKYATADVYLYLDLENDVVVNIRISGTNTSDIEEKLRTKKPQDVIYKKHDVQKILNTIKYEELKK